MQVLGVEYITVKMTDRAECGRRKVALGGGIVYGKAMCFGGDYDSCIN